MLFRRALDFEGLKFWDVSSCSAVYCFNGTYCPLLQDNFQVEDGMNAPFRNIVTYAPGCMSPHHTPRVNLKPHLLVLPRFTTDIHLHNRVFWRDDNAVDLHSGGAPFESQPVHGFLFMFLSRFR